MGMSAIVASIAIVGAGLQPASAYPRPGRTELVSVSSDGTPAEYGPTGGYSTTPDLTPSGRYVAFHSTASNLVPRDTTASPDIFVRDRKRGNTELVSLTHDGSQAIGPPGGAGGANASISATGRYVAFQSSAINLVPGDTNLTGDVFVRDRKKAATKRVSVSSSGAGATSLSSTPSISGDGRYVAFRSFADNLVENDTNNGNDIFVHDLKTRKTVRASVDSQGNQSGGCTVGVPAAGRCFGPDGDSSLPSISGNGRYVAFASESAKLVSDDTNGAQDIFVHDLKSRKTVRISVASDGAECSFSCDTATHGSNTISATGRYVIFSSTAANLVPNDTNNDGRDTFVHDLKTGRTERVSVTSNGERPEVGTYKGPQALSANGRYAIFTAAPTINALLPSESCRSSDCEVYLHDRDTGALELISVAANGRESEDCTQRTPSGRKSFAFGVSDGGEVAFTSCNPDLVANDAKDYDDIFVRNRGPALAVGGFGGSPSGNEPPDDRICIEDICIPPGASVAFTDELDDVDEAVTQRGANLIGGRVAHRAPMGDLYAVLELDSMPRTPTLAAATAGLVYGMSFEIDGNPYEVRVASTGLGSHGETTAAFGLFDCSSGELLCTKVTDLKGGFGTTGERIVFSLPLDAIGIEDSVISEVNVFTALGTLLGGPTEVLDRAKLK